MERGLVANKQHSKATHGKGASTQRAKSAKGGAPCGGSAKGVTQKGSTKGHAEAVGHYPKSGPVRNSLCAVSRDCGACQLIDVPYDQQLARKDAEIAQLFEGLCDPAVIKPTLGMADPFHYRNKVMSPFAPGKKLSGAPAGRGAAPRPPARAKVRANSRAKRDILCGMYAAGTHRIIDSSCCLLENPQAQQVVQAVRAIMLRYGMEPYDEDRDTGFVRHVVVRVGHSSGEVLVTLVTNGAEFTSSKAFCRELVRRCPFVTTVVQNVNTRQTNVVLGQEEHTIYGPGFILDELCGLSFRISSQSFYQVNSTQTEVLYRAAVQAAGFTGTECAIDAYCGTGTIGLVAAKNGAAEVVGVDCVASSVRDARQNAAHNGIKNARFEVGDAGAFLRELAAGVSEGLRPGAGTAATQAPAAHSEYVLMMDPPRAGSTPEFLGAAAVLKPRRIVYISCNPETQVRDLRFLCEHGFEVREVQPVDMFPHTHHTECIAVAEPSNI